jgi:hypothetical protein
MNDADPTHLSKQYEVNKFINRHLTAPFTKTVEARTESDFSKDFRPADSLRLLDNITDLAASTSVIPSSARTRPSPGIHACKRRNARVPRLVLLEHLSRTRRRDCLQAIGAW